MGRKSALISSISQFRRSRALLLGNPGVPCDLVDVLVALVEDLEVVRRVLAEVRMRRGPTDLLDQVQVVPISRVSEEAGVNSSRYAILLQLGDRVDDTQAISDNLSGMPEKLDCGNRTRLLGGLRGLGQVRPNRTADRRTEVAVLTGEHHCPGRTSKLRNGVP